MVAPVLVALAVQAAQVLTVMVGRHPEPRVPMAVTGVLGALAGVVAMVAWVAWRPMAPQVSTLSAATVASVVLAATEALAASVQVVLPVLVPQQQEPVVVLVETVVMLEMVAPVA